VPDRSRVPKDPREPATSADGRDELTTPAPSELRFGHYRVVGPLGTGLFARIYRAVAEPLGRTVVLKVLESTAGPHTISHRRFAREARLLSSLRHPNIVELFDYDEGAAGERPPFMVLELVEGPTLKELLDRLQRLEPEEAAAIGLEVARGLAHAHRHGVVHRDVKPGNVLIGIVDEVRRVGEAGEPATSPPIVAVKLADFGAAKSPPEGAADAAADALARDESDGAGTPAYMSPEQLLGEEVDARADQFALGIVLYQMIAGVRPFDGDDGRPVIQRVRREPPKSFRAYGMAVPKDLERIVFRCLAKRPSDRYADTQDLVVELARVLEGRADPSGGLGGLYRRVLARAGVLDERRTLREEGARRGQSRTSPLRVRAFPVGPTILGLALSLFAMAAGGAVVQWRGGPIRKTHDPVTAPATAGPQSARLKVLARPWAEIGVDGQRIDVTPIGAPLVLRPGRHVVTFAHPAATTQRRVLELKPGEEQTVEVTMDVPMPVPTDEYAAVAPSASVVAPPGASASGSVAPGGRGSPFGVPTSLGGNQPGAGGTP
jgi:serine/threonine-protein kinase